MTTISLSFRSNPTKKSLTSGRQHVPEPFDSERLPSTLASDIQRFLRVANLLETDEPRIAYLCRFHAFEVAHNMDKNSTGRGVRQFKTSLLQRLELDDETTIERRKEKSDARELRRVYDSYNDYFTRSSGEFDLDDSRKEKLINTRRIAYVLEEVLRAVESAADPQALADRDGIQAKSQFYVPYNILPLAHGGIQHAILQLFEVKAAIAAVRNTRGLPPAQDFQKSGAFMDLFEFLHYCFGFQEGNVANQREHLILLLANIHIRQSHKQSFNSKMAYELHGILTGAVSMKTGENVMPAYGGGFECFLNNVVTPIYQVIFEEAEKNKSGTADHSTWRNYDDLNEYFWSPDCFQIGWPMRLDHDFFCVSPYYCKLKNAQGSPNVAMIIMACHDLGSPLQMFDAVIFEDILSIFITSAILKLIHGMHSVALVFSSLPLFLLIFTWKARRTMESSQKKKYMLKLVVAVIWTIVLPVLYANSRRNYTCYSTYSAEYKGWLGELCFSSYMVAVTIYLMTNAVELPRLYVGCGMQETQVHIVLDTSTA
ncbi:hypothetical protein EZV62_007915 [Acer yangbiense]|uniref:1,3-beta-glucan synthase component FKS1-like domain-containing protein n=1 Tax=Acer yangbiense TaxID=1000413 RepID=A0A5C7IBB5_9ROSI|nr:hypothetical protein EZV62_007915 [Acer yangbiense]